MSPMNCKVQPYELEKSYKSVVVNVGNMVPTEGHTKLLSGHKGMMEN
jgi:hypothetical protein